MLKELTDQAQGYLGNRKPFSAVTDWIDRLCTQRYAEEEYDGIPELVEAINLQSTGPTEASRALRKKLKYSNVHGQKRALIILKALVENCGQRFQTTFANDQLVDRIKIMSQDQLVDASVRRLLMRVLLSWHQQFKDDPSMRMVAGLYAACGGGKKSEAQKKNEAAIAYRKLQEKQRIEAQIRSDRKAAEQLQKEEDKKNKLRGKKGVKRPAFNFEQEKPAILQSLAISQQVATALVNALQHVNREKESVTENARVQDYLVKTKVERKKIIRYVQLVKDEEFLGSLISANDQIILALELYDRLSKPADLDSDDEEPLAAISGSGQTAEEKNAARMAADDAEIEMVRKRIADARLNAPDSELEKLQTRQRVRIHRHNSRVGSMRSFDLSPQPTGAGTSQRAAAGGGALNDLIDLDFQEDHSGGGYHQAQHGSGAHSRRGTMASEAAGSSTQHGALSDYSDYESEDSADEHHRQQAPGGAHQLAVPSSRPEGGSWSNLNDSEEEEWLRTTQNHRPSIGPGFSWNEDEDADDDPFADPFADANNAAASGSGWGIERPQNQPRKEWGVV
ncbi:LAS seventeen-binding protein 5 [Pseudozyma hubeiensis]|nr:LAS seventeen-binding protein 5 [Pseudozyma hubeiensis]